jgi:hypothetical protein
MAEEAKKKEEPKKEEAAAAAPPAGKGKSLTFGIFGGLMIVEAVVIFAFIKVAWSEPDPTHGMEPSPQATSKPWEESAELALASVRVPNSNGSRTLL